MSKIFRALLAASLIVNVVLIGGAVWAVAQAGMRPLAELLSVVEPRRAAYDVYAAERFDELPGGSTVVIGDSQAEYGPWSELMRQPVAVRGQSGATTAEIAGWAKAVPTSTGRVIVLAGSNDVLLGTDLQQLREDATRLYRSLPGDVVAVGVPPLAGKVAEATEANLILRDAAKDAGVSWVDPSGPLSGQGKMRLDGVHLTGRGYVALVDEIRGEF